MKKIVLIQFILFCCLNSFSQQLVNYKIINIVSYPDGSLFTGVDSIHSDTVKIISVRSKKILFAKYKKITINNSYVFSIEKLMQSQAYLDSNFTIKIKKTVVWSQKDGFKNIPVVSKNTNNLYIKIE